MYIFPGVNVIVTWYAAGLGSVHVFKSLQLCINPVWYNLFGLCVCVCVCVWVGVGVLVLVTHVQYNGMKLCLACQFEICFT